MQNHQPAYEERCEEIEAEVTRRVKDHVLEMQLQVEQLIQDLLSSFINKLRCKFQAFSPDAADSSYQRVCCQSPAVDEVAARTHGVGDLVSSDVRQSDRRTIVLDGSVQEPEGPLTDKPLHGDAVPDTQAVGNQPEHSVPDRSQPLPIATEFDGVEIQQNKVEHSNKIPDAGHNNGMPDTYANILDPFKPTKELERTPVSQGMLGKESACGGVQVSSVCPPGARHLPGLNHGNLKKKRKNRSLAPKIGPKEIGVTSKSISHGIVGETNSAEMGDAGNVEVDKDSESNVSTMNKWRRVKGKGNCSKCTEKTNVKMDPRKRKEEFGSWSQSQTYKAKAICHSGMLKDNPPQRQSQQTVRIERMTWDKSSLRSDMKMMDKENVEQSCAEAKQPPECINKRRGNRQKNGKNQNNALPNSNAMNQSSSAVHSQLPMEDNITLREKANNISAVAQNSNNSRSSRRCRKQVSYKNMM